MPTTDDAPPNDGAVTADVSVDTTPSDWLEPWARRRPITITAAQVTAGSGGLDDFPLLVAADIAGIGAASLAAGADLVFTDAGGLALLDAEIEQLTADRVVAWVKVPNLSNVSDTRLYLYYGNASPPPANPELVWTGYKAVWHLSQDPGPGGAGQIADASANNKDGTAHPSMAAGDAVAGNIGRAIRFDGIDDFIDVPSSIAVGDAFTLSAWINVAANATNLKTIFSNSLSGLDKNGFRLFVNSFGTTDRKLLFETSNGGSLGAADIASTDVDVIALGTWVHVAAVVDRAAGNAHLFVDGADRTLDASIRTMFDNDSDVELGRMGDLFPWQGMLDEIQIASAKLPPEWIKTAFDNQKPQSTLVAVGEEELAP